MKTKIGYILSCLIFISACKGSKYVAPYLHATGYVVAQEQCYADSARNPWILDLSYPNQDVYYGDSVSIHGQPYLHAMRTFNLPDTFKSIGMTVGIFFNSSDSNFFLAGCDVDSPITFKIKEAKIITAAFVR